MVDGGRSLPSRLGAAVAGAAQGFRGAWTREPADARPAGGFEAKLDAVQETVERAAEAPREVLQDVRAGVRDIVPEIVRAVAAAALVVLLVGTAYIVFTIWLVVALNAALGDPWGTLVAWILLAAAAAAGAWYIRESTRVAAREAKDTAHEVEEDVARVARPVQDEFGGEATRWSADPFRPRPGA